MPLRLCLVEKQNAGEAFPKGKGWDCFAWFAMIVNIFVHLLPLEVADLPALPNNAKIA
ncbi:hypothetical protein [Nostoc sp.]|uniref:hypothetical protein n=1 Tax=Nostoc sp. TaxID=1180 RepID=UPI002FF7CDE0